MVVCRCFSFSNSFQGCTFTFKIQDAGIMLSRKHARVAPDVAIKLQPVLRSLLSLHVVEAQFEYKSPWVSKS